MEARQVPNNRYIACRLLRTLKRRLLITSRTEIPGNLLLLVVISGGVIKRIIPAVLFCKDTALCAALLQGRAIGTYLLLVSLPGHRNIKGCIREQHCWKGSVLRRPTSNLKQLAPRLGVAIKKKHNLSIIILAEVYKAAGLHNFPGADGVSHSARQQASAAGRHARFRDLRHQRRHIPASVGCHLPPLCHQ